MLWRAIFRRLDVHAPNPVLNPAGYDCDGVRRSATCNNGSGGVIPTNSTVVIPFLTSTDGAKSRKPSFQASGDEQPVAA
jgi:hypothetical protein